MKLIDILRRKKHLLLLGASILMIAFSPIPNIRTEPKTVIIPIRAESFAFDPGVIHVNRGDQVVFELTSMDVVHGIHLDTYDISVLSDPGQTATLSFIADRSGSFNIRCSVTCGALHPFMIGKLKVGSNDLVWRGTALAVVIGIFGAMRFRDE